MLPRENLEVDRKRLFWLYREERLPARHRVCRKRAIKPRAPIRIPPRPNERWSLDLWAAQLADGRRFWILAIVDDCIRECLAQVADMSME